MRHRLRETRVNIIYTSVGMIGMHAHHSCNSASVSEVKGRSYAGPVTVVLI
jgi:hypothetical protein